MPLYKVWRDDILAHAFALSRHNGGAPGVDGETFARIEACGVERWLAELKEELRTGRYTPQPVREPVGTDFVGSSLSVFGKRESQPES